MNMPHCDSLYSLLKTFLISCWKDKDFLTLDSNRRKLFFLKKRSPQSLYYLHKCQIATILINPPTFSEFHTWSDALQAVLSILHFFLFCEAKQSCFPSTEINTIRIEREDAVSMPWIMSARLTELLEKITAVEKIPPATARPFGSFCRVPLGV